MNKPKWIFAAIVLASLGLATACSTDIDEDGVRAGAIEISIEEVTSDELYPSAGDEIDWKMIFLPTPGDIIVNTFWDRPYEIFNVEVGVYDRFGIPILVQRRDSGGATGEVRTFVPEAGLHYIKLSAESGRSIYSANVKFESNYDGFVAPSQAPSYSLDLGDGSANLPDSGEQGKGAKGASKGLGAGNSAGNAAAAPAAASAAAGAVVLPTAAAGGAVVLPTAAVGGIASAGAGAQAGPTVVRPSSGGAGFQPAEVKTIESKQAAVSNTKAAVQNIVGDLKGSYDSIEADIRTITPLKKGTQIRLGVGRKGGVKEGAIGEIYVDGKVLSGGRFRVDKIQDNSCIATTNAASEDVRRASKFVIKVPK